jgi:manganese/iron transport system permease protein
MNFFEPFQYQFMQSAMLAGSIIALMCAVLSCFLILRGWSLMGDAISHAVLPGIVLAYLAGIPLVIGAFFSGLFCAAGTGFIKQNSRIKEDTVMGVVFTGMFAFGLVLFSKVTSDLHLDHILFGNILGLTDAQVIETGCVALPVLLTCWASWVSAVFTLAIHLVWSLRNPASVHFAMGAEYLNLDSCTI